MMCARGAIATALFAALLVSTGCNLLAPPPSALPPVAMPAAPAAAPAPTAAHPGGCIARAFGGLRILCDRIRNRLGMRFPGLESKPPLTAINDPANLDSPTPAIAAAAEVKAEEDAAEQKIKALRYLASVGCTACYPSIAEAMRAALDDCTEAVRYEAVKAIRKTVGDPCQACLATRCCQPEILKRLREMAYDLRDDCCHKEPSARVRRLARLVLSECGGGAIFEPAPPREGPSGQPEGEHQSAQVQARQAYSLPSSGQAPPPAVEFRWEQLTASRNRFESAAHAQQALAYVRQMTLGQPAARPADFDPKTIVVRTFDWTPSDQASSVAIARALLQTPVAQPSVVIEDHDGWHLVLVRQRRPEYGMPSESSGMADVEAILDRTPRGHDRAYLDERLFSDGPPTQQENRTRPTRIIRPDSASPDGSVPLTFDPPRRLPEPAAPQPIGTPPDVEQDRQVMPVGFQPNVDAGEIRERNGVSTVQEITVQCPLAPRGRGQGEGAESASVISRTVLSHQLGSVRNTGG